MNEGPSREMAARAADLTGADIVFYVVNDYWWESEKIIETAKNVADEWLDVDSGKITIFEFKK